MAANKLNLFQVLSLIGKKNRDYFKNLSDEERKAFHPLVVMRWMTGTSDARQVIFMNELVNPYVFSLSQHKPLVANLITAASSGNGGRVKWIKATNKKIPKFPMTIKTIQEYYGYNTRDAVNALQLLSDDDIVTYAEHLGKQPEDVKLIKKELKSRVQ